DAEAVGDRADRRIAGTGHVRLHASRIVRDDLARTGDLDAQLAGHVADLGLARARHFDARRAGAPDRRIAFGGAQAERAVGVADGRVADQVFDADIKDLVGDATVGDTY